MRQFRIIAEITKIKNTKEIRSVKGFYYQGKNHIVLVGDENKNHTIREKFDLDLVKIYIENI
jgi:hypothetical protein